MLQNFSEAGGIASLLPQHGKWRQEVPLPTAVQDKSLQTYLSVQVEDLIVPKKGPSVSFEVSLRNSSLPAAMLVGCVDIAVRPPTAWQCKHLLRFTSQVGEDLYELQVTFDDVLFGHKSSDAERQAFWEKTRRLGHGTLVLLWTEIALQGPGLAEGAFEVKVTPCVVSDRDIYRLSPPRRRRRPAIHLRYSLCLLRHNQPQFSQHRKHIWLMHVHTCQ